MSSFFCRKFVFFVSFQHLVSAFFSSTTLCVAGVLSAPPLGDFRKSDRQCMLSIEFAQQIHKFRGRVPRNLYKGRKNVPAGRGFSSVFARKRGFEREAARKTIVFRQPQKRRFRVSFSGFVFFAPLIQRFPIGALHRTGSSAIPFIGRQRDTLAHLFLFPRGHCRFAAPQPLERLRSGPELIAVFVIFRHNCIPPSHSMRRKEDFTHKKAPMPKHGSL